MKKSVYAILAALLLVSCKPEYAVYDNPFVYVKSDSDAGQSETSTVSSNANNLTRTYNICLSSKTPSGPVTVSYEIIVGDGIREGIDYTLATTGSSVKMVPGVYMMPIRVTWLRNKVDPARDNSLTIRITGVSPDMQIGFPGQTPRNVFHKITKVN